MSGTWRLLAIGSVMLWLSLASALALGATLAPADHAQPALTAEESAWIAAHPVVEVGVFAGNHFPLEAWVAGAPEGMGVDYAKLLAARVGLRLQFRPFTDWDGVALEKGDKPPPYDLLLGQQYETSTERFHYLPPFVESYLALVARKGDLKIRYEADLEHARIVVERIGRPFTQMVKTRFPDATLIYADDGNQALEMLSDGTADGYIGPTAHLRWLLTERERDDLTILQRLPDLGQLRASLAVAHGNTMLADILAKASGTVTADELNGLRLRWGIAADLNAPVPHGKKLTAADRQWLMGIGTLRLGYETDRYPYSFMSKDGRLDGLAGDYVNLLKKELGLRIELVPAHDLDELQRRVAAREVDLVAAAMPADFDPASMVFSRPYERFPEVIVTRLHGPIIAGPEDLPGKKVSMREEAGLVNNLRALLPGSQLIPVASNEQGLKMVEQGLADAYIGTLPAIDALIRDRYAASLRVVAPAGLDQDMAFGVAPTYAPLAALIDQAIGGMKDADRQTLRSRWLRADYHYGVPWRWVIAGLLLSGVILAVVGAAYKRMKGAEARARASQQLLVDTNENLPGVVVRFRASDDSTLRYEYVGGPTPEIFGVSHEDMLSGLAPPLQNVIEEDRPRAIDAVERSIRRKHAGGIEFRARVNGQTRWIRVLGGEPKPTGEGDYFWSVYCADVTTEKEQEQALREAKATAEAAVTAKAAFLAMMSHEIRTPMAGVVGLVELLRKTSLGNEQANMLGMVQDSSIALLQILDDILDFSRMEALKLEMEPAPFDLRQLADSAVGTFAARAQQKNLKLYLTLDWRLAGEYQGDGNRIRQIINNLLSNAIKFTEQGFVKLHVEMAQQQGVSQRLRFVVIDSGIGMSEDQLRRLFQPFTQAEASTTRRFGGTGLGLSICRRLAQMMDGDVQLSQADGAGTQAVFELELPVLKPKAGVAEFEGKRALVCTSDAELECELVNALSAMGFSVVEIGTDDLGDLAAADAALLLVESGLADRVSLPASLPLIRVTTDTDARGSYMDEGRVMLCGCPLLWRSALEACRMALGVSMASVPASLDSTQPTPSARILVAEDHPINRAVVGRQLDLLGYPHTMVDDGQQAWEALQWNHYDMLISDCHMPVLDGYELTRRIREAEKNSGRHLPIVALSASALPEQVQKCRAAGMDGFLAKPMQLRELESKILQFVRAERVLPAPRSAEDDQIDHLAKMFGSEAQLKQLLEGLVATGREDVARLDEAMAQGDTARQYDLMHRIVGLLRLIDQRVADARPSDVMAERRDSVLAKLADLDHLVSRLSRKH